MSGIMMRLMASALTPTVAIDQVTGFGGSAKRNIGRRVMGRKLKDIFEKERAAAAR